MSPMEPRYQWLTLLTCRSTRREHDVIEIGWGNMSHCAGYITVPLVTWFDTTCEGNETRERKWEIGGHLDRVILRRASIVIPHQSHRLFPVVRLNLAFCGWRSRSPNALIAFGSYSKPGMSPDFRISRCSRTTCNEKSRSRRFDQADDIGAIYLRDSNGTTKNGRRFVREYLTRSPPVTPLTRVESLVALTIFVPLLPT